MGMTTDSGIRAQEKLKKLLLEMAVECFNDIEIAKKLNKFLEIYSTDFRHTYSKFFPLMVEISKENNEYDISVLSFNINALSHYIERDINNIGVSTYKPIIKLIDHLNLEIGRYNQFSSSEQKIKDLEKRNEIMKFELRKATGELRTAKDKMSTVQTELIAVLSIFAAIVLTFAGGINIIGSALSNVNNTPILKSLFVLLICGIVIFNIIFCMMYLVGKITGRNIYANCKTENCTCGENEQPKCLGINRIRKRLPYVFWFNTLLILLLISTTACYLLKDNVLALVKNTKPKTNITINAENSKLEQK